MQRPRHYLVYLTKNLVTGHFYIGCHETYNVNDGYLGSGKRLKSAILKYGKDKFKRRILRRCRTREEMFQYEHKLVGKYLGRKLCYNLAEGGKGGWKHVNDTDCPELKARLEVVRQQGRIKANKALRARYGVDPELTERCRAAWRENGLRGAQVSAERRRGQPGPPHSEETKAKIGAANSIALQGENNPCFGKAWIANDALQQTSRVQRDQLEAFFDLGWRAGRVMRYEHVEL